VELSLAELTHVCGLAGVSRLAALLPHFNAALPVAQIDTPLRLAHFLAQTSHESADYTAFEERLNYSADGLLKTWPRHFTPELAAACAHQPERIANVAYADRMGNGDVASGDGWKYRGRGAIQITGFDNYHRLSIETGTDFLGQPDLAAQPEHAFLAAARFWTWHGVNVFADRSDLVGVRKAVNGGIIGLEDCDARLERALEMILPQPA
jgi:putative chitinase